MMKSFFKKLAFVMALAMVVSAMAPAATAKAAEAGLCKQESTTWEIIKADELTEGATQDYKFANAPANWRTLGLKWVSSNPEFATVDEVTGLVTAVKAGTTTIAVKGEGYEASLVLNVKSKEVVKTFEVKQTTANTVEIKFADAAAATDKIEVIKIGKTTTGVETTMVWPVNKVEVKNGVATVTTWANFGTGDYRFVANGTSVDKSLKIGNPDFAVVTYTDTYSYSDNKGKAIVPAIAVYDENGVKLTGYTDWYFELENTGANAYVETNGNLYLWAVGAQAKVKGTLTYVVGNETKTINAYADVTCQPVPEYKVNTSIEKYALVKSGTATDKIAWSKTQVIIGPDTYHVAGIVKDSDNKTKSLTSISVDNNNGLLDRTKYYAKYESSDKSVVLVHETDGTAIGVNVGSAYVLVSLYKADPNGDSKKDVNLGVIAAIPVAVDAARKASGISLDKPSATLLTSGDFTDVTVKPAVVDQYNEAYGDEIVSVYTKVNDKVYDETKFVTIAKDKKTFTIDAADFALEEVNSLNFTVKMKSGLTTNFVLTIKKLPQNVNKEFTLQVNGAELLDATKRTAKVAVVSSWAGSEFENVEFYWGKPDKAEINDLYVTVTAPDGKDLTADKATHSALTFAAITGTDKDGKLTTMAKGQYIVKLNKVTNIAKDSKGNDIVNATTCDVKYFDVNHNLKGITDFKVKTDKYTSSDMPIDNKNVEFKFDGKAWTDAANAGITVLSVDKKELNGNLYVYSFTVKIPFGEGYYTETISVGKLFTK